MLYPRKIFSFKLIILFSLISVIAVLAGCASSSSSGYRKVTLNQFGTKLSFEYPASFEDPGSTLKAANSDEGQITLYDFPSGSTQSYADQMFQIVVSNSSANEPNAQVAMGYLLHSFTQYKQQFQLISQSTAKVAGIQGGLVVYSAIFSQESIMGSQPAICRDLYFDYNGQIWDIGLKANKDIADQANTEFNHILASFKFLS